MGDPSSRDLDQGKLASRLQTGPRQACADDPRDLADAGQTARVNAPPRVEAVGKALIIERSIYGRSLCRRIRFTPTLWTSAGMATLQNSHSVLHGR